MSTLSTTRYRSSNSFIDRGHEYNYSRKDADCRIQNARHSEYKRLDSPVGWLGPEETKGAPEKSICLPDGEAAESRQTRLVKVSARIRSESIDLSNVSLDKTSPFERNKKSRPPPIELEHNIR